MPRIRILAEHVANKIAAGEVVERPASVVKELLENALDAGARSIRVEVESGGKRMIRVIDDGCGMIHDDALLAFERHATSKLRNADDLLSISTLGFRGEALPSIASVSRLLLQTRAEEDAEGTRIEFAGGKLIGVKPEGLPLGTTISVADLFYCVPARRNFLKSETTELGHIASLVTHYALAHPDKQFVLKTPTQEIINTTAVESMADRVYQLFGRQALDDLFELLPVSSPMRASITETELAPEERGAEMVVRGFASRPEVQRGNRNGIYVFVNKRLVRDRLILHAIHEAYRNVLPPSVFPAVLLFLDMPAEEVDVNVHPAKIEVRFRHPQFVHDFTRDSIRQALSRARPIPSFTGAAPEAASTGEQAAGPTAVAAFAAGNQSSTGLPRAVIPPLNGLPSANSPMSRTSIDEIPMDTAGATGAAIANDFELTVAPLRPEAQRFRFEGGIGILSSEPFSDNVPNFSESETLASAGSLTELKPLGQVNSSFIVAVNGEGLWIIDQHVAHERVLFEQHLRARREGQLTGQRMLVPIMVDLAPRQLVILERIAEELTANGFEVAQMGPRSVAIHAAPAGIVTSDAERLLMEILDGTERENAAVSMDSLQAKIAASTSCHAAIKVNMPLDQQKMEWLLAELAKTEAPMSCPHGRPIVLRYSVREIERAFKRI
ncbi:MAG TPA: DNA mismatch repair endonuclease MutL [Candidatus Saccharimonadales bacterium]|jgi:DNA mismatch repair protein MutL|nr:DNA mismatch repair endonuclease MutL [Candidatus Saccharimonadales bacterium]